MKGERYCSILAGALISLMIPVAEAEDQSTHAYQLRANIALANSIDAESAKRYGIGKGSRDALVNVVVLRSNETVPAEIKVLSSNLTGQPRPVEMRATTEAGRTSYLGVYKYEPDEVVDFDIAATPEGSGEPLRTRIRQHFPAY